MVLADGIIDVAELQAFYKIGLEDFGLSQDEVMNAVSSSGTSYSIPETLEGKLLLLYNLAKIAWADGEIDETERHLLEKYVVHCGFAAENAQEIAEYILNSAKAGVSVKEVLNKINKD